MDKNGNPQLELFSQRSGALEPEKSYSPGFLSRIRSYEKIILLLIGFIVVGVISFSLGVEKGRGKTTIIREPANQAVAQQQQPVAQQEVIAPSGTYTIQVASFQTKTLAQKEERMLKNKGHYTMLLNKKGYTILCVGKFSDKNTARTLLAQLKKRYGDCYIRRF